jgi:hypothetical protein
MPFEGTDLLGKLLFNLSENVFTGERGWDSMFCVVLRGGVRALLSLRLLKTVL